MEASVAQRVAAWASQRETTRDRDRVREAECESARQCCVHKCDEIVILYDCVAYRSSDPIARAHVCNLSLFCTLVAIAMYGTHPSEKDSPVAPFC